MTLHSPERLKSSRSRRVLLVASCAFGLNLESESRWRESQPRHPSEHNTPRLRSERWGGSSAFSMSSGRSSTSMTPPTPNPQRSRCWNQSQSSDLIWRGSCPPNLTDVELLKKTSVLLVLCYLLLYICNYLFIKASLLRQPCCSGMMLRWWPSGPDAPLWRARSPVTRVGPANTAPYLAPATTGIYRRLDGICRN